MTMNNIFLWHSEDGTFCQVSKSFDPITGETETVTQTAIKVIITPAQPADMQLGFQEGSYKVYADTDLEPVVGTDYVLISGKRYDIKRVTILPDFQVWEVVENG
ncbi:hypothetical protein [Kosmotoga pacifica]|uniref:Phage protein n=1 Tax=Kosmotoga pacifica TaxID=1330330 RepID=A0A0G2Z933_9BACT|nr:hypothetical protein [Kosmotoga pacifica]AKI96581.1 hypothetical protein IX53_00705 [Kosmotoga pacifica]